eukprot:GHRR01008898.1.p1 GENE.GHRR01008898.1~~GHRR01008898.1.p1  ORF type:complete len:259 (+),score=64.78 GHRR01008898.1:1216-1992(+)
MLLQDLGLGISPGKQQMAMLAHEIATWRATVQDGFQNLMDSLESFVRRAIQISDHVGTRSRYRSLEQNLLTTNSMHNTATPATTSSSSSSSDSSSDSSSNTRSHSSSDDSSHNNSIHMTCQSQPYHEASSTMYWSNGLAQLYAAVNEYNQGDFPYMVTPERLTDCYQLPAEQAAELKKRIETSPAHHVSMYLDSRQAPSAEGLTRCTASDHQRVYEDMLGIKPKNGTQVNLRATFDVQNMSVCAVPAFDSYVVRWSAS